MRKTCDICGTELEDWCTTSYCQKCCVNKKCPLNKRCEFINQMTKVLKTSEEWAKERLFGSIILEPNGWNNDNNNYSWFKEKINQIEFIKRCRNSALIYTYNFLDYLKKHDEFIDGYKL